MKNCYGPRSGLPSLATSALLMSSVLTAVLVVPPLALAEAEIVHVSAGIGDDDPIELEAMRHDHNLQLVFALKGSGAYLADVKVAIHNAAGEKILSATSPGPLFFVSLPRGQYRVDAEFKGQQVSKAVKLAADRRSDVFFYWEHE